MKNRSINHLFTRTCAVLLAALLAAFSGLSAPARAAPQAHTGGQGKSQADTKNAQKLKLAGQAKQAQKTLQSLERALRKGKGKAETAGFRQSLTALDGEMRADFATVERFIDAAGLPEKIRQRHAAALQTYVQRIDALLNGLAELESAADADAGAKTQNLLDLLHQSVPAPAVVTPADAAYGEGGKTPPRAPYRALPRPTAPYRDKERLQRLFPPAAVKTAMLGPVTAIAALDAPNAEDLAESVDVQITPEIAAQAAILGHNPVKVYRWMYDNIDWIPLYGSLQGAGGTFKSRRGNAFDSANLFIALLRASGIEARYVYSTIKIPAARLINWSGAPDNEAARRVLSRGGIPHARGTEGGVIAAVEREHVWVQAWIDFEPSRGARHKTGDTWVALDAAYKTYRADGGLDWESAAFFDGAAAAGEIQSSASYGDTWTESLPALSDTLTAYTARVKAAAGQAETVGALLGRRDIDPVLRAMLPGGAPYDIIAQTDSIAVLPESMRWHRSFRLYADTASQSQNIIALGREFSLPALAGKSLSLRFEPAADEDRQTLAELLPAGDLNSATLPDSLPGYLIHVKAKLYLDDELLEESAPFALGTQLPAVSACTAPERAPRTHESTVTAGEYRVWGHDLQGGAHAFLSEVTARLADTLSRIDAGGNSFNAREASGDGLEAMLLGWFALHDLYSDWQAAAARMPAWRAPSFANARTLLEIGLWTKLIVQIIYLI